MAKSFALFGLGRFGKSLAVTLAQLGCEVMCMDSNEKEVQAVADVVTHAVIGDCRDEATLKTLGIPDFDVCIVSLASNIETSVLLVVLLKELGAKRVLAKSQSEMHSKILRRLGADEVVFPENDMGVRAAYGLVSSGFLDYIELSDGYRVVETSCPKVWLGKTVAQLDVRRKYGVNILAVKNGDKFMITDFVTHSFVPDDVVVVLGESDNLREIIEG